MRHRPGFTLLELMAVLALMAMLSGVIGLSLASVSRQTTVRDAVGAMTDIDRSMRDECKVFNRRGEIRIDVELGRITRVAYREGEAVETESYQLPNTLRIEKLWMQGQTNQSRQNGVIVIQCDRHGHTPTYALSIRPYPRNYPQNTAASTKGNVPRIHAGGYSGGLTEVVPGEILPGVIPGVIAGLTGHVQECQDEAQVNELFASLASHNAD